MCHSHSLKRADEFVKREREREREERREREREIEDREEREKIPTAPARTDVRKLLWIFSGQLLIKTCVCSSILIVCEPCMK